MPDRMSIWGIGPTIGVVTAVYLLVAVLVSRAWPDVFAIEVVPYRYMVVAGVAVLVAAIPFYVVSVRAMAKAYGSDSLVTTGVYAICRNPIYAGWILLILPALGLLLDSWLVLGSALLMYAATRQQIHREEEYLEARFGQDFLDYKARVGAILPRVRRR